MLLQPNVSGSSRHQQPMVTQNQDFWALTMSFIYWNVAKWLETSDVLVIDNGGNNTRKQRSSAFSSFYWKGEKISCSRISEWEDVQDIKQPNRQPTPWEINKNVGGTFILLVKWLCHPQVLDKLQLLDLEKIMQLSQRFKSQTDSASNLSFFFFLF